MMKDFSMHLLDIVQNSIRAGASEVTIELTEDIPGDRFSFSVTDNGCGMDAELLARVRDPFTTSRDTRKVGLGIPMLEQTCDMCGGHLELESTPGLGTRICAVMEYANIDRPPLGPLESAILILVIGNPEVDYTFVYRFGANEYILDMREVKDILDGVDLSSPEVIDWLRGNIDEGVAEARGEEGAQ